MRKSQASHSSAVPRLGHYALSVKVAWCTNIGPPMSGRGKLEPKGIRPFEGAADPAYLLSEIEELRDIARRAGLGSLDDAECAAVRWLVHQRDRAVRSPGLEPRSLRYSA